MRRLLPQNPGSDGPGPRPGPAQPPPPPAGPTRAGPMSGPSSANLKSMCCQLPTHWAPGTQDLAWSWGGAQGPT